MSSTKIIRDALLNKLQINRLDSISLKSNKINNLKPPFANKKYSMTILGVTASYQFNNNGSAYQLYNDGVPVFSFINITQSDNDNLLYISEYVSNPEPSLGPDGKPWQLTTLVNTD